MNKLILPANWRELVVAEAKTWIGTRYHHSADVKGHGVDCAMLLVRVYCDLGIAPIFDPRPYAPQWYLHRTEEKYIKWLESYGKRIDKAGPGDVALYRFGRCAAHGAIIVDDNYMIHAYVGSNAVMIRERRAEMPHGTLDSYWTPKEIE